MKRKRRMTAYTLSDNTFELIERHSKALGQTKSGFVEDAVKFYSRALHGNIDYDIELQLNRQKYIDGLANLAEDEAGK